MTWHWQLDSFWNVWIKILVCNWKWRPNKVFFCTQCLKIIGKVSSYNLASEASCKGIFIKENNLNLGAKNPTQIRHDDELFLFISKHCVVIQLVAEVRKTNFEKGKNALDAQTLNSLSNFPTYILLGFVLHFCPLLTRKVISKARATLTRWRLVRGAAMLGASVNAAHVTL